MQKYHDIVLDNAGNAVLGATITVSDNADGGLSTIYSDNAGTALANPFTASAIDGAYSFYAADGRYNITITATGFDTESLTDIWLSGDNFANKAAAQALKLTANDANRVLHITSDDGGKFVVKYNATPGTYADNGGSYCGTQFIPTGGDGTIGLERDYIGSVKGNWFGAYGLGADYTTEIQAAINYANSVSGRVIELMRGTYVLSATLLTYSNVELKGQGGTSTILKRTGSYGNTIAQTGGFARISGFYFVHGTMAAAGDTTLNFLLTDGTAHIRLTDTQDAEIRDNIFWRMPYGVVCDGSFNTRITGNWFKLNWDNNYAAMQEGTADLFFTNTNRGGRLAKVKNNYFSGTAGASRNTTYSDGVNSVIVSQIANIGAKNNILALDIEDLDILGNYFGRASSNLIRLSPSNVGSLLIDVRIIDNFFDNVGDGTTSQQIVVDSSISGNQILGLTIDGNTFNGEYDSNNAIVTLASSGTPLPTVTNMQITNNSIFAHTATPIRLQGSKNTVVAGNTLQAWNGVEAALITSTNYTYRSGVYVGGESQYVMVHGNSMGGGSNTAVDTNNYCYSGVTIDSAAPGNIAKDNFYIGINDGTNIHRGLTTNEAIYIHTTDNNYQMLFEQSVYIRKVAVTAARSALLPKYPMKGQEVIVKDGQGDAGTWLLQVATGDGTTIDGAASVNINTNYGYMKFLFNGTQWNRIV